MRRFWNLHKGGTCLLVGNGPNLCETPPEWFAFPSFGMNTCHLWGGAWMPDYYTTVDQRVRREFGEAILAKFAGIPKFIPRPNLDSWQGPNFHRFYHRPIDLTPELVTAWPADHLDDPGLTYSNIMHIAMQLAYFMGFTTMLIIGMEHRPAKAQEHFWGVDHGMTGWPQLDRWFEDYRILREGMARYGVKILNISENTYVPEAILPRDDWRKWVTHENSQVFTGLPGPRDARAVLSQG